MSGFSTLNLANSALLANQRALEVAGQNIANAQTEGYTRQRVELKAGTTAQSVTFYSRTDGIGNGVSSDTVTRIRDAFLERRSLVETGSAASAVAIDTAYEQLETSFGEPSATGLQKLLTTASAAWSGLSTRPLDTTARTTVLAANQSVATALRNLSGAVEGQWSNTRATTADTVTEANAALQQVADLNGAIRTATVQGLNANDLLDQRDLLVGKLATSLGATTADGTDGMVDVVLGGSVLVSGQSASKLALGGTTSAGAMGPGAVTLRLAPAGAVLTAAGTVGGQLTVLNSVLPSYKSSLDGVAASLASTVNAALAAGYDQDGAGGGPLFSGTTAGTLTVVLTDPRKLAAAKAGPTGVDASADGRTADALSLMGQAPGSAEVSYRSAVTRLGVEASSAAGAVASVSAVVAQLDMARSSVSGVSLDEEMTNLMMFKQSYAAAARLVTAIDEMLDVLINRTGLVGR